MYSLPEYFIFPKIFLNLTYFAAKIWANRCYKTVCMGVMSGFLYSTVKGGTLSSPNAMGIGKYIPFVIL